MAVTLLAETPLVLPVDLGPYRVANYLRLPDEPRTELILGRLYLCPTPDLWHQVLLGLLLLELDAIAEMTGGLAVQAPLDVTLADHSVVQPDLIYVAPDRREVLRDRIEGAPSLVVEVLSPPTKRRDRGEKLKLYAEQGIHEYWIVDGDGRHIEFLVNRNGSFVVTLPEGREYRSPVLTGIRLVLDELWATLSRRKDWASSAAVSRFATLTT